MQVSIESDWSSNYRSTIRRGTNAFALTSVSSARFWQLVEWRICSMIYQVAAIQDEVGVDGALTGAVKCDSHLTPCCPLIHKYICWIASWMLLVATVVDINRHQCLVLNKLTRHFLPSLDLIFVTAYLYNPLLTGTFVESSGKFEGLLEGSGTIQVLCFWLQWTLIMSLRNLPDVVGDISSFLAVWCVRIDKLAILVSVRLHFCRVRYVD